MKLKNLPYGLMLVTLWFILRYISPPTLSNVTGLILILASFLVMAIEFVKSGDIGQRSFLLDLTFSNIALSFYTGAVAVAVMSQQSFGVVDFLIGVFVATDAWIGPTNSFRTALRNWAGSVNTQGEA